MRACQVLRPRRVVQVLALTLLDILPSTTQTASAPGIRFLSRLNGWPARPPTDASPTSSRMPAHGLGSMWVATPSSQWTCTTYSLPVYRRTCAKTRAFNLLVESSSLFGQSENQKCWRRLSEEGYRETGSTLLGSRTFSHGLGQTEKDRDQPQHGRYTSNTGHRAGACHRSLTSHGASSPVSLPSANPGTSNMPNRAESIGEGRALGDYLAVPAHTGCSFLFREHGASAGDGLSRLRASPCRRYHHHYR